MIVKKLSDVVKEITELDDLEHRAVPDIDSLVSTLKINIDGSVCFVLGNYNVVRNTVFTFNAVPNIKEIELFFEDPLLFTQRTMLTNRLNFHGSRFLVDMAKNTSQKFNMEIGQEVFVENAPNINCIVYPNKEYESYAKCDQDYVKNLIGGFVPIWNIENISLATRRAMISGAEKRNIMMMAEGEYPSSCKPPCTTTRGFSQLTLTAPTPGYKQIGILIKDSMKVTKTDFVDFSLAVFLSNVGGSLGLWLGLGVLQLGEQLLKGIKLCWKNIFIRN